MITSPRSSIGYQMRRGALLMREQLEQVTAGGGFTFSQWITLVLVRDDASVNSEPVLSSPTQGVRSARGLARRARTSEEAICPCQNRISVRQ